VAAPWHAGLTATIKNPYARHTRGAQFCHFIDGNTFPIFVKLIHTDDHVLMVPMREFRAKISIIDNFMGQRREISAYFIKTYKLSFFIELEFAKNRPEKFSLQIYHVI
jgi:hypothetical protein